MTEPNRPTVLRDALHGHFEAVKEAAQADNHDGDRPALDILGRWHRYGEQVDEELSRDRNLSDEGRRTAKKDRLATASPGFLADLAELRRNLGDTEDDLQAAVADAEPGFDPDDPAWQTARAAILAQLAPQMTALSTALSTIREVDDLRSLYALYQDDWLGRQLRGIGVTAANAAKAQEALQERLMRVLGDDEHTTYRKYRAASATRKRMAPLVRQVEQEISNAHGRGHGERTVRVGLDGPGRGEW